MSHYTWKVGAVPPCNAGTPAVALEMEATLNALEEQGFEVYDVMDAPLNGRLNSGLLVVGRKPRRFPDVPKMARRA
jgi:hypothetical protein